MAAWTVDYFGPDLLTKDGPKPTAEALAGKTRIGIYFSGHWCPPCRRFTPVLSEFYEQLQEEDASALAIVFASSDFDVNSFNRYYGSMPWFSMPFAGKDISRALSSKFGVTGIPELIILDAADGSVKDSDGCTTVTAAAGITSKATAKWA